MAAFYSSCSGTGVLQNIFSDHCYSCKTSLFFGVFFKKKKKNIDKLVLMVTAKQWPSPLKGYQIQWPLNSDYRIYHMYFDRQAWANSEDPDGTP